MGKLIDTVIGESFMLAGEADLLSTHSGSQNYWKCRLGIVNLKSFISKILL